MDAGLITKIASAGAMGVSIYCIYKVYNLLQKEQDRDEPRPVFIRTIYVSMGFAVLMTILSLGIEFVRDAIGYTPPASAATILTDEQIMEVKGQLKQIEKREVYAFNKKGNPTVLGIHLDCFDILLTDTVKNDLFDERKLSIGQTNEDQVVINSADLNLGYLDRAEVVKNISVDATKDLTPKEQLFLGLLHAKAKERNVVKSKMSVDYNRVKNKLFPLLELSGDDQKVGKDALRVLIQKDLLDHLDYVQHETLLEKLTQLHRSPYVYFEKAQVYLSRSKIPNSATKSEDLKHYRENLKLYVDNFPASWFKNPDKTMETGWLDVANQELGI